MRIFPKSLSNQLLTGLLILSILPSSIIGLISYNSGRKSIIKNVQIHLKSTAIQKQSAIKEWTNQLQQTLSWVANEPLVATNAFTITYGKKSQKEYSDASDYLASAFKRIILTSDISQISIISKSSGQIIFSSKHSWEGKIRANELFFEKGKKGLYISEIFLNLSMGQPTMVVSGPIIDNNGNLIAILAAHADFTKLSQIMLERTGLSETTEVFLVNKSNLLITNTVFAPRGAFKKWIFGEGAKRAIKGKNGVDQFFDYRGIAVLGAYLWLDDRKLALIAKQDAAEAFEPIKILGKRIFLFVVSVSILIFFLSFIFTGRITKPLQKLMNGATAIGKGDLNYRIQTNAQDEIGVLSNAFNDMAKNLNELSISRNEKEVLLREIHHRVKNNMQVIISLLSLQAQKAEEEKFSVMVEESQNRIKAMSLVHERLYQSHDLANINFKEYVKNLIDMLLKSYDIRTNKISVITEIENISFDLENAIPCGLIINELVSNAFKHAFARDKDGTIKVSLNSIEEKNLELIVKDNGIGLPQEFDINNIDSLGLDLTKTIVEHQLGGKIVIDNTKGAAFHIIFKRQKYKTRV